MRSSDHTYPCSKVQFTRASCRFILAAIACAAGPLSSMQNASAQITLIPKTIRLVVPFPPDNASDFQARVLGDQLRKSLGITVVVDNRPAVSGGIALQYMMASSRRRPLSSGACFPLLETEFPHGHASPASPVCPESVRLSRSAPLGSAQQLLEWRDQHGALTA